MTTDFKFPPMRIPTDDEVKKATKPAWEAVKPTLLSRLHPFIQRLSIPTFFCYLPVSDYKESLIGAFDGKVKDFRLYDTLKEFSLQALRQWPEGFFFKLDSRSPKDVGIVRFTEKNHMDLAGVVFSSERILDDLVVQSHHRESFVLCFRQWVELKNEQRVFIRDGKIQGVSRYDYGVEPAIEYNDATIATIMTDAILMQSEISQHMQIDSYVFDFGYKADGTAVLIEVNPYGLSDPCCFVIYENIKGYAWNRKW